jgi:protein-S-isoprenylcysteine O-methyltransferase
VAFQWVLLGLSALWVLSETALGRIRRSREPSERRDAGSLRLLHLTIWTSVALGVLAANLGWGHLRLGMAARWAGLALVVLGLMVRWSAILTLKKWFTVDVAIQAGHRIVRHGLYRYLRHPSYSGTLISFVGLGLAFSSWISLLLFVVPPAWALHRRIQIEERALEEAFGDEYREYCRRTRRLVPGLY